MHNSPLRDTLLLGAAAAIAVGALFALAASTAAAPTSITIKATNWTLKAPARVPSGYARFTLDSPKGQQREAIIGRLNAGITPSQVRAALKKGGEQALLSRVTAVGGISGDGRQEVTVKVRAGTYGVFGTVKDAQGKERALSAYFSVSAAAGPQSAPRAAATVRMMDMMFHVPDALPAGPITLRVVNEGPSMHEMALAKIQPGKTYADVLAYLKRPNPSGPPPVDLVNGSSPPIAPHQTEWLRENFTPGQYVLVCFVTGRHGEPHVADGMIATFTVQ